MMHAQLGNLLREPATLWDFIKNPLWVRQACYTPACHNRASWLLSAFSQGWPWKSNPAKGEVPFLCLTNISPQAPPTFAIIWGFMLCLQQYRQHRTKLNIEEKWCSFQSSAITDLLSLPEILPRKLSEGTECRTKEL